MPRPPTPERRDCRSRPRDRDACPPTDPAVERASAIAGVPRPSLRSMPWDWVGASKYCYAPPGEVPPGVGRLKYPIVILRRQRGMGEQGDVSFYVQGELAEDPARQYIDDFDAAMAEARHILLDHGHDPYR
jgi:hypothetical protein